MAWLDAGWSGERGASAEMTSILRGKITIFARAKEKQSQHITCFLALHVRRLQKRTVESTPQTQETQAIAC